MNSRPIRLLVIWNVVLSVLLLLSLGVNAVWVQAANDPPVQVVTVNSDDIGGDHSQSTTQKLINGSSTVTLLTATVSLSTAHTHTCLVTASADTNATNHASTHNLWLNMDSTSFFAGSQREVYFTGADNQEVTSLYAWDNLSGSHTFYFAGSGSPQMAVNARSMTIACFKTHL